MPNYYEWRAGESKNAFATRLPMPKMQACRVVEIDVPSLLVQPAARRMEVQEGSATETFFGRVRDFWKRKK